MYKKEKLCSGIYRIRNIINDQIYIGQSKCFPQRRNENFNKLRKGIHHNKNLQRDYDKLGRDSFVFEILLYCDIFNLNFYEQLLVDEFNPFYNIYIDDILSPKGRRWTEDRRKSFSESRKGIPNKNKFSEETIKKMSLAKIGKVLSEETKIKMGESHKGQTYSRGQKFSKTNKYVGISFHKRDKRWRAFITYNNKNIHIGSFGTDVEAALAYNEAALKYFGPNAKLNIIE